MTLNLIPRKLYAIGFTPALADRTRDNDMRELATVEEAFMNDAIDAAIRRVVPQHLPDKYHGLKLDGFRNVRQGECAYEFPDGAQVWVELVG